MHVLGLEPKVDYLYKFLVVNEGVHSLVPNVNIC